MLIALLALILAAPGQSAPQAPRTPPTQTADAGSAPQAAPRQVCRFETVTGSNRRTRVCRAPSTSTAQDQATREAMRDMQRPRMPDAH